MAEPVLISICIPAYKRGDFLKRLLDSIAIQTFRNFEVVLSDDSPDDEIRTLTEQYQSLFELHYYRNVEPAGTPENWNLAIRKASGSWIKLMHDDDWFAMPESLQYFAQAIRNNPSRGFIFSAYDNVMLESGKTRQVFISAFRYRELLENPVSLFSRNVIGPPSVVLHRADQAILYDPKLKWVVDIDFYIRWLRFTRPLFINHSLVKVGLHAEQVTQDCFRRRPIEIPENFYLLKKAGTENLRNFLVYDAWWRLMRNLEIRNLKEIRDSGYAGQISLVIVSMIRWQAGIPAWALKSGVLSKMLMAIHYVLHFTKINP